MYILIERLCNITSVGDMMLNMGQSGFLRIVEFQRGGFGYNDMTGKWCYIDQYHTLIDVTKDCKIIGNIWENKELLGDSK